MGGRHDKEVLIGGYVPPRKKAIIMATLVAMKMSGVSMNQLGLIWQGVCGFARAYSIIDEKGRVTKEWADTVALLEAQIVEGKAANSRGRKKGDKA